MGGLALWKGNEAMSEAAIRAGIRYYFGYPITPQNEVAAYMSRRLPEVGGVFLQAESEVAAINMVFGAAAAGGRVMTTTSSPGFSLMQEGISYIAAAHLPVVLANVMRGGPGLGNIAGAQGDYFQATKGGGHGDYKLLVLAPASVQEIINLTIDALRYAEKYLMPVLLLFDGILGQMMEPAVMPSEEEGFVEEVEKPWALTGAEGRPKNIVRTLWLDDFGVENNNLKLQQKYARVSEEVRKFEKFAVDNADVLLVAYGTPSRICKSVVRKMRSEGVNVGLFRPITLWPFPDKELLEVVVENGVKKILVVEMSSGQMLEDVKLAIQGRVPVEFYGRMGGGIPEEDKIIEVIKS